MQKRLCGREQEFGMRILPSLKSSSQSESSSYYGVDHEFENWRRCFVDAIVKEIASQPSIPSLSLPIEFSRLWLGNGSLIYIDLQCLLEVANAEYLVGSFDGLLQEKASELIINAAAEAVAAKEKLDDLSLYKNTVGPTPNGHDLFNEVAYASHHNYSYLIVNRIKIFKLLASFLPISLPLSGSGHIRRYSPENFGYVLSQKAPHVRWEKSQDSTTTRPLINIRDESLMNEPTLSRLHLICRDATRCEFQTWLVDMVTHLVLRLAEEGWQLPPKQRLDYPINELQLINSSFITEENYKVEKMDLIDYNYLFLNAAKQLSPLSESEKRVLQEWERVLELLKARAFDKLVGELDWATKWFLLKQKMAQHSFGLNDVRAWKINTGYHHISPSPKKSQFARLDQDGYIKHLVSQDDIEKAKIIAPDTRAKSRGEFVKLCLKNEKLLSMTTVMNWASACIRDPSSDYQQTIYFGEQDNPFTSQSSTLEKICRDLGLRGGD